MRIFGYEIKKAGEKKPEELEPSFLDYARMDTHEAFDINCIDSDMYLFTESLEFWLDNGTFFERLRNIGIDIIYIPGDGSPTIKELTATFGDNESSKLHKRIRDHVHSFMYHHNKEIKEMVLTGVYRKLGWDKNIED